jgi:4'-phosphopantetheinyl transferase EntD
MTGALEAALRAMLGGDAGIGCAAIGGEDGLFPQEMPAIARAVPKRRAEFAAGRRAARAALAEIGIAPVAVPVGDHRAPVWPEGVVGAITHDAGVALAAVARSDRMRGLGIDVTEAAPLPGNTRRAILPHAAEQGLSPLEERAVFSAKESLFKALFPFLGTYFGFEAAAVRVDLEAGGFEITLAVPLGPWSAGTGWTGRVHVAEAGVLTGLVAP